MSLRCISCMARSSWNEVCWVRQGAQCLLIADLRGLSHPMEGMHVRIVGQARNSCGVSVPGMKALLI